MKNLLKNSIFIFVMCSLNISLSSALAAPPKKSAEAKKAEAAAAPAKVEETKPVAQEATQAEATATDKKDTLSPVGVWWTKGQKAKVELYEKDSTLEGKIIWLREPDENGTPKVDKKNPDEKLRSRPILNLAFLTGFKKASVEQNKWIDGSIYDAESGKTYNAWIKVIDENNLQLRGYVGVSLFGRTEEWTRVTE